MILAAALLLQAAPPPTTGGSAAPARAPAQADQMFDGMWLDVFEGQQFVAGSDTLPTNIVPSDLPALTIDRAAVLHAMLPKAEADQRTAGLYSPHAYHIRFVGRRDPAHDCRGTASRPPEWGCVGSGGVMPYGITVERVIALEDRGVLPH